MSMSKTRVIDPITAMQAASLGVVPLVAYDATTSLVLDVQGMKEKAVIVKNPGGNGLTYNILGSLDGGAAYDITVKADTAVGAGGQDVYRDTAYYTHWKVQVKATAATTANIKAAAIGV